MTSQWPDNCDASTWKVISDSLDIDFIHANIHGRSCKKKLFIQENAFESVVYKIHPFCSVLNVLKISPASLKPKVISAV